MEDEYGVTKYRLSLRTLFGYIMLGTPRRHPLFPPAARAGGPRTVVGKTVSEAFGKC